jgi:mannose-6-phosphate isomerase
MCRMGTHPSGPALVSSGPLAGTPLLHYVREHSQGLGDAAKPFKGDLPFLLKILSVRKALSIQSHPDKELAKRLHSERPSVYKDANHKPEMAIALTEFQALCGFCAHEEVLLALEGVPELRLICGEQNCDAYMSSSTFDRRKAALRNLFTALMTADKEDVESAILTMIKRLRTESLSRPLTPKELLVTQLNDQYPTDVGVLAAWFLNYIKLAPGEAIALAANEPHAYIRGEIVECMATSDNVIRAGLTPKLRDTEVLCSSLTYNQGLPKIFSGEVDNKRHMVLYRPPFDEFEVWKVSPSAGTKLEIAAMRGPSIILVQHGEGIIHARTPLHGDGKVEVRRGRVLFVPAGVGLSIASVEDLILWIAAANGMGPDGL